jgi:L-amino acid N-acyltransferase
MVPIRPAIATDVPAITELYNALLESTTFEWRENLFTAEERLRWLREKQSVGHPVLVATDDGEVVGVGSYGDFRDSTRWPGYRFTIEHSIHVSGQHWNRGIGRSLISGLGALARLDNKRVMVAGIDAGNVRSIRFHVRLGFDEVARMPGVGEKWGQRLELVLMQCDLGDVDW